VCTQFEYDVAFSFLAEDEGLARELNELIRERAATFLYSERQAVLAGTDGEYSFNEVFLRSARTVVVLYRTGWGTTPWTRIEETAIRNRAYQAGYGFVRFIPLTDPPELPAWLPRTQIWYDLARFGPSGAAAIILQKIADAGAEIRPETAVERAARAQRLVDVAAQRQDFRDSAEGVAAFNEAVEGLFVSIRATAARIGEASSSFRFLIDEGRRTLVLRGDHRTASVDWQLPYLNTLMNSKVWVRWWRGSHSPSFVARGREDHVLDEEEFDFTLDDNGTSAWSRRDDPQRRNYSNEQLADRIVIKLIELIEQTYGPSGDAEV
jgi:hypothetical protein